MNRYIHIHTHTYAYIHTHKSVCMWHTYTYVHVNTHMFTYKLKSVYGMYLYVCRKKSDLDSKEKCQYVCFMCLYVVCISVLSCLYVYVLSVCVCIKLLKNQFVCGMYAYVCVCFVCMWHLFACIVYFFVLFCLSSSVCFFTVRLVSSKCVHFKYTRQGT